MILFISVTYQAEQGNNEEIKTNIKKKKKNRRNQIKKRDSTLFFFRTGL